MNHLRAVYEFGDFTLDVGQQRLSRRAGGESVALTGKTFDTLVYLLQHAGEPLSRETLMKAIWPEVVVEENSLTQIISALRQMLGEARGENRYIATLPRTGYRFVAGVTTRDREPAPAAPTAPLRPNFDAMPGGNGLSVRRGYALGLGGAALVLIVAATVFWTLSPQSPRAVLAPSTQELAILPFKPLLPAERNEALGWGVAEALIANVAQNTDLAVRPFSSVRRFAAPDQDAIAAGRELNVDTVLDGLMQRDGDRLRVSVRLLRVSDGRQLWSQSFEQPFTGIFDVEDAIVGRITQGLSRQRAVADTPKLRRETQSSEAFVLYANGRFAYLRLTEPSLTQAAGLFEQAVTLDPNYARAYAGIADCNALLGVLGVHPANEVYPKARSAAEKAIMLNPQLAAAYSSLGQILLVYDHDQAGAGRALARAIELDPNYAPTYFYHSVLNQMQGDLDAALADMERAMQLDPYALATRAARALILMYEGRTDESIVALRQILALDDRFDLARSFLMRALLAKGEYQQVLSEMDGRMMRARGAAVSWDRRWRLRVAVTRRAPS
jgi:DNA-binding winged helix-turn-helix (wHTH) protein/TolB-like protein/Tfp pilus assembly protein PilF